MYKRQPFAHPAFTVLTGIGVGLAVASRRPLVRLLAPVAGFALAVVAHAVWNASTLGGVGNFFAVYAILMLPAFGLILAFALYRRRNERQILREALEDAAGRGLLPATDIDWLVDLPARRHAREWALRTGGAAGQHAMREYQAAAIELGYLHHRFLRGTAPADAVARGQHHVDRLSAVRPLISFPGQVVPTR